MACNSTDNMANAVANILNRISILVRNWESRTSEQNRGVVVGIYQELDRLTHESNVTIELADGAIPEEWRPCCFTEFRNQWCFQCPWCGECHEATERKPGQPAGGEQP